MSRERKARKGADGGNVDRVIHEIDGIQEYDNKLPNWWLYTLYGSIAFSVIYWYVYHSAALAPLPLAAYEAEKDRALAQQASEIEVGEATPEALVALSTDPTALALGKQVFTSACAACHRGDGGGSVGPNLTDEFWLHGGAPEKIFASIASGIPDKGMPAWLAQLGAQRTQAVTGYVISLQATNAPGGKAPQGEREITSAH